MESKFIAKTKERADELFSLLKDITGVDGREKRHFPETVACRIFVTCALIDEGVSMRTIGRTLGKAPCTIIHYRNRMEEMRMYPRMYRNELAVWEEFKQRISQ